MRRNYKVTVRRICAAVALVMVTAWGIPALAPAPAALASPAVASAATHSTPPRIHPHNADDCMGVLASYGYKTKTDPRMHLWYLACQAAGHFPNPVAGVSTCMGGLVVTGILPVQAFFACTFGLAQRFSEEQWCDYNQSSGACLNAWGGGPYVNVYKNGPEISDTHGAFAVFDNTGTGYSEIAYTGSGSWAGRCIGDASNDSSLADVSLDSCGSGSGGQGWGVNFTWGTSGCPAGEAWFKNVHWNGYLGPPANFVNGSHFYLNKPSKTCLNYFLES